MAGSMIIAEVDIRVLRGMDPVSQSLGWDFYAELSLGGDGSRRNLLGGLSWEYGRGDERDTGFLQGGSCAEYHNAGNHVVLERNSEGGRKCRVGRADDKADEAGDPIPVSTSARGTSGSGQYFHEYDC